MTEDRRTSDIIAQLKSRVASLEARLERVENRPLAGRPPERLRQVTEWLKGQLSGVKGGRPSRDVLRAGTKVGFSEALIRKAAIRLGVAKESGWWTLERVEELVD